LSYAPLFLLYSPAPHPDLHSFPTRRSSDLADVARVLPDQPEPEPVDAEPGDIDQVPPVRLAGLASVIRDRKHGGRHQAHWDPVQDRKSTRLNSSHQIISYAVFCLKKKNT